MDGSKESVSSRYSINDWCTYVFKETMAALAGSAQFKDRQNPNTKMEKGANSHP